MSTPAPLRLCGLLVTACCVAAGVAQAQADTASASRPSALVRYGKWATLGAAGAFAYLGAATHDRADRDYNTLLDYCRASGPCPIGADGHYTDPHAEALYRRVRDADRLARGWLVGGQLAILTSAVLFVLDLKRGSEPKNIPFSGYVAAGRFGTNVGVQVRLGRRR